MRAPSFLIKGLSLIVTDVLPLLIDLKRQPLPSATVIFTKF
jgi:hypothetical protein